MFQVLSISSLGIWLGNGEGKMGRGVNKTGMGCEKVCGPGAVVPMVHEDLFITVDELV